MATPTTPSAAGTKSTAAAVPWWGWLAGVGLLLWASNGALHTPIVLVLVAALIYQFTGILK